MTKSELITKIYNDITSKTVVKSISPLHVGEAIRLVLEFYEDTDNLPEGTTNLYFTSARVQELLPAIVNNLTSGGTTSVLSAEQGKALKNLIDTLPTTKVQAGTNVTVTGTGTDADPFVIASTDTNTTYSAGPGLALSSTTFNIDNLQKVITTNYTLTDADDNHVIFVNNSSTAITITVPAGLKAKFSVGFIQEGTADVTFAAASGVSLTNPTGLKSKGQGWQTFIEKKLATETFYLLGNTKV